MPKHCELLPAVEPPKCRKRGAGEDIFFQRFQARVTSVAFTYLVLLLEMFSLNNTQSESDRNKDLPRKTLLQIANLSCKPQKQSVASSNRLSARVHCNFFNASWANLSLYKELVFKEVI